MNPREMHGIICDGDASKFSCLVETLNLVHRGYKKNRAFSVARSQNGLAKGERRSARQRTLLWYLCGKLPVQREKTGRGVWRSYEAGEGVTAK